MTGLKSFDELRRMRPEVLGAVIHWLEGKEGNLTGGLHLRPALSALYPTVLTLYSLVLLAAVLANCCLVLYAYRHRLYLLLNHGLGNLLVTCPVLPPTVAVLIFHDWLLGRTACHLLPLLQDMSTHFTVLSHLVLAVDGYREVQGQARLSPKTMALAIWLIALCLVLPYISYITYTDLAVLGPQFQGFGICYASLSGHVREYIRTVVLLVYLLPFCLLTSLYVRMRRALLISLRHLDLMVEPRSSSDSGTNLTRYRNNIHKSHIESQRKEVQDCYTQVQCLGVASAICSACLCPLMVLRVTKTRLVEETSAGASSGDGRSDLLFCLVVWFAFLPTLTSPLAFLYGEFKRSGTVSFREFFRPRRCSDCQSNETTTLGPRRQEDTQGYSLRPFPSCDSGPCQGVSYL